jgi:hypothetical protein
MTLQCVTNWVLDHRGEYKYVDESLLIAEL